MTRYCKLCKKDISDRHKNARYCETCVPIARRLTYRSSKAKAYSERKALKHITVQPKPAPPPPPEPKPHKCQLCGKDISDRKPNAVYCLECAHQISVDRMQARRDSIIISEIDKAKRNADRDAHFRKLNEAAKAKGMSYGQYRAFLEGKLN